MNYPKEKIKNIVTPLLLEPESIWLCSFCTFANSVSSKICEICDLPIDTDKIKTQANIKLDIDKEIFKNIDINEENILCPQCGVEINKDSAKCECGIDYNVLLAILAEMMMTKSDLLGDDVKFEERGVKILTHNEVYGHGIRVNYYYPDAERVLILGDFNKFGFNMGENAIKYELIKNTDGIFSLELLENYSFIGQKFKYYIELKNGKKEWRNDPRSVFLYGGSYNLNDIIYDNKAFKWTDQDFKAPSQNTLVIYETHILNLSNGIMAKAFIKAIEKLDYLVDLGINAIEIMPITQDIHDKCWGYDVLSLFAVHRQYGTPDELKMFINEAHKRNIAVILDWVPNHFIKALILHDNYFYAKDDSRHSTRYGPRPNYKNPEVRNYIIDSLDNWITDFHFDGIRVDSIETMRYTSKQENIIEAWTLCQEITDIFHKKYPNKLLIAEDLQNEGKINQVMGFDVQWDARFFSVMLNAAKAIQDYQRNSYEIARSLEFRYESTGFGRVIYTESHDTICDNREQRLVTAINPEKNIEAVIFAKKRARVLTSFIFCGVGIPMIMVGQEILEERGGKWPNPPFCQYFNDINELPKEQIGNYLFSRDIIALRKNFYGTTKGLTGPNIAILHINENRELPILAFHRWDKGGTGDDVIVIANISNLSFEIVDGKGGYWISFPRGGEWKIRLNTNSNKYNLERQDESEEKCIQTVFDHDLLNGYMYRGQISLSSYSLLILSQD